MNLYKGLPHRTIYIGTEDKDIVFGVSTEETGRLIGYFIDYVEHNRAETAFDNATAYYVPEEVFLAEEDETVIQYIKQNIDENVTG